MGFTSPPPPPDKVAESLWNLSVTLETGQAPSVKFGQLPEEERHRWIALANTVIRDWKDGKQVVLYQADLSPSTT